MRRVVEAVKALAYFDPPLEARIRAAGHRLLDDGRSADEHEEAAAALAAGIALVLEDVAADYGD
jgi:hypothetical protein